LFLHLSFLSPDSESFEIFWLRELRLRLIKGCLCESVCEESVFVCESDAPIKQVWE
jgi:hypothetical protein